MSKQATRALAVLAAVVLAAALSACGSSGDDSTTPTSATSPGDSTDTTTSSPPKRGDASAEPDARIAADAPSGPTPTRQPKLVPKGGDGSIQTYGTAAPDPDYQAIAKTVQAFQIALARSNTRTACALLSTPARKGLVELGQLAVNRSDGKLQAPNCAQALRAITKPTPATKQELQGVRVIDARIDGDEGFAIYRMPGLGIAGHAIARENGTWKVASLGGVPLE